MNKIKLGSKTVSSNSLPYLIAEIGVNHECSISKAKKLILLAKKGGADAAKFQTYKADLITSKYAPSYWDTKKEKTKNQLQLFKKYDLFGEEDYKVLFNYCKQVGIEFLSTPFDHKAVDMLDKYVNFFKVSSSDITNFPLLKKIALKKKPILLSTGASTLNEIKRAYNFLKKNKCNKIVIMHCILNYPTKDENANLNMITSLLTEFPKNIIGYSDHTIPNKEMNIITSSYLLGARVIEKHFTLNKKIKGNDHYHSMDFKDLKNLSERIKKLKKITGINKKNYLNTEILSRKNARRSIVVKNFLKKNSVISSKNLICKRPGTGIAPYRLNFVVGKKAKKDLVEDYIIKRKDIE